MMQNTTIKKRILISLSFVTIFVVAGLVLYYLITPAGTCFDGKKNQAEKAVDCGGTCAPCSVIAQGENIIIKETAIMPGGNDTYDAVAKIMNPNDSVGASSFKYVFNLKDLNDKIIATREGSAFILPTDSRYVAELGFQVEKGLIPARADIIISDVTWEKIGDIGKPQIGVYSKNFGKIPMGIGSEADGIIRNESGYDLGKIFIVIVLRSENGEIVGVNRTEKNTVRTREERDFHLTWTYNLPAPVQGMEVDTQSNIFDRQNILSSF